jgi:two-component system cell cycle sensor histidine kinase/response regulator CckA
MSSAVEPSPAERERIVLVVDDERDVRELVRHVLRINGLSPLTARDGKEALDILEHLGGKVDLVLSDLMMPTIDGPTLAQRMARDWPRIPVLFMTGYPSETLAVLGILPEEAPRIEKPFRIRELLSTVRGKLGLPPPP